MKLEQLQTLDSSSRLFVYSADSVISNVYKEKLVAKLDHFISTWEAHGVKLNAAYELIVDRMLIIAVDERNQQATGCSIDNLNNFLKSESVNWFDRQYVHYLLQDTWKTLHMIELIKAVQTGKIHKEVKILNSTVLTLEDACENLLQSFKTSWLNKML